jgi:hypothetical protein
MVWLLDGNVLAALAWLASHNARFASCAQTQGTLLRVHMTVAADHSAGAAWNTLATFEAHPRHDFWDDGFAYSDVPHRHLQGAKQVSDAWLAQLAKRRKGRIATFDAAFALLHADVASRILA